MRLKSAVLASVSVAVISGLIGCGNDDPTGNGGPTCSLNSFPTAVQWRTEDGGNDHLYDAVAVGSDITWEGADQAATARSGNWHLATITSAAENDFVESLITGDDSFFNCCQFPVPVGRVASGPWLGATSSSNASNDWEWVTEEDFTFTDWGPREPFGNGDHISYAEFGNSRELGWNDIPSGHPLSPRSYVVECTPTGT